MAAKPSGLSVAAFSAGGKLSPPNGLPAAAGGFGENMFDAPESPKMFLVGKDESEAPKGVLGLASGDVCMESATGAPLAFVAAGCPNRPEPTELPAFCAAFCGAPNEKAGCGVG